MCGRFTRNYSWAEIHRLYRLAVKDTPNLQPHYNICPTTTIDAVIPYFDQYELVPMRWGLIPNWWSKPIKEMKLATFNARAETVAEKPIFRDSFKRRRCLIPASGYYEWQTTPEGKQYYYTRRDGQPITMAGIYDCWTNKESNETLKSCAIVDTMPNEYVGDVHDRMPVILEEKDFSTWLREADTRKAAQLMQPAANDVLQKTQVSRRVNGSRANDEDGTLIEAIEPPRMKK
jgi:putative SOS response-associated peptidase YedK